MPDRTKGHSRRPAQWLRATDGQDDPYRAALRIDFLDALDRTIPDASPRAMSIAGPAFEALADHLEGADESHPHDGMPWVLADLLSEPSPPDIPRSLADLQREARSDDDSERADLFAALVEALYVDEGCPTCLRLATDLRKKLLDWATPYHLHQDPWVVDHAFTAFQMHRIEAGVLNSLGDSPEPFRLGIWTPWVPTDYNAPHFPRGLQPWPYRPDRETREGFMARVEVYADRVDRTYEAAKFEMATYHPNELLQLRWLVQFHCDGWTYDKVAGPGDSSNVRKSIARLRGALPIRTPRPRK